MTSNQRTGELLQADFFNNTRGLNITDSPFRVLDEQATDGYNYNYAQTGGIQSRLGHTKINTVANSQLVSLGLEVYNPASGSKVPIRYAGTKIQNVNITTPSFTDLSEDTTTASFNFLNSSSTQPVVASQFNNGTANVLWAVGGGMSTLYGVYSTSKVTANGVVAPTNSSFTATAGAGSSSLQTGTYRYTIQYRKASTQALSNVGGEASVSVTAGQNVTLAWTLTNNDTTKYDQINVYRSALNGATAFTTGDLIAQLASSATGYTDTGTSIASSQNIPRAGNTILDNSQLPSGTYTSIATFKRRLVTAKDNVLYISDLNKSESWPTLNTITVPSGGAITGLAVISFTSPQAQTLDEILAIYKDRELWVLTGDSASDWVLKFIDDTGCPNQSLIVLANGYLSWMDVRGVYLWDGAGKPIYCSRPIESLFARDGLINKGLLNKSFGEFYRKSNQIIWYLSNKSLGEQVYSLKLDLRLTLPQIEQTLTGRILEGVFIQDKTSLSLYSALSYLPTSTSDELLLLGDGNGFLYQGYQQYADSGSAYQFTYATKSLDLGTPGQAKRFHKVIVWVEELGMWDLYLDYWSDYISNEGFKSTLSQPISTKDGSAVSLWDVALWDVAFWDNAAQTNLKPLVFNLQPGFNNNSEGDSIRIRFRTENANNPIVIAGFSIIYSMKGLTK